MDSSSSRSRRPRLTYANAMSTLAVFLVLAGGTALAAGLPKNSVGSKTVKDNSLTSADLADGKGASGEDVVDGSLQGADVAAGALPGSKLAAGALNGADVADGSLGGADFAAGSIGSASLGPKGVSSANIADGSLETRSFERAQVNGRNIDESSLGTVPNTLGLGRRPASSFLTTAIEDRLSASEQGIDLGDGTFKITEGCGAGQVMLSGGPAGMDPNSSLVESFPKEGTWTVRINPHGRFDLFRVGVACAVRNGGAK